MSTSTTSVKTSQWATGERVPLIRRRNPPITKRCFDVVASVLLIVLLFPVLFLVTVYIKVVSPGSAMFIQERPGHGGKKFRIFKFRTMKNRKVKRDQSHREYVASLAKSNGELKKPDMVSEMIPGGALLRKLSLDELPQLFNILRGEMSLVGPRPDLLELNDYDGWHLRRFEVLPGLTGLWQISRKNDLTFNEMIELDLQYVDTQSFWLDLRIVITTAVQQLALKNS
ncbi:MAG: sugar transferase [Planctomycetota bacterium]